MSRKIYASLLALIIALTAFAGKQAEQTAQAAPPAAAVGYDLLNQLPASDFIAYADARRMLTEIVPNILSDSPEARARFEDHLNKLQKETGFDLRTLDAMAVGFNFNESRKTRGYELAIIARGRFDAQATIETAFKHASEKTKGRIEKQSQLYEGRTIYVDAQAERTRAVESKSQAGESGAQVIKPKAISGDNPQPEINENAMAFVALDANTIAFGSFKSVKATIDASMGRERVSDELVGLATRNPNAAAGFSGTLTPEMARSLRFGPDKALDSIASIRQVYGSFNLSGNEGEAMVNLRTETAAQASQLGSMMRLAVAVGRQHVSSKSDSFESLIKNLSIEVADNEVQVSLKFAHTDLAPFFQKL